MPNPFDPAVPVRHTALRVLRVFVAPDGGHGNELGVFVNGSSVPRSVRQEVATRLRFSETVFVDDLVSGELRIFTPAVELKFAGHPVVGTAWVLNQLGLPARTLRPLAGEVRAWQDAGLQWVRARPEWIHPMRIEQLDSARQVESLSGPPESEGSYYCWAWLDGGAGVVRSRYFAPALGVAEDEATGAGAIMLTARLGRAIEIVQGKGSRLFGRPGRDGTIDLGGRCVLDEARSFPVPVGTRSAPSPAGAA